MRFILSDMFVVCFVFSISTILLFICVSLSSMSESVTNLKIENNALKAQLSTMVGGIAKLQGDVTVT